MLMAKPRRHLDCARRVRLRQESAQANRLRELPAPELVFEPKSCEISCDSDEAGAVADDEPVLEPGNAWIRLLGVVAAVDEFEPPNRSLTSCNCSAAALNCTRSDGEAFCRADCTVGEDSAEETD